MRGGSACPPSFRLAARPRKPSRTSAKGRASKPANAWSASPTFRRRPDHHLAARLPLVVGPLAHWLALAGGPRTQIAQYPLDRETYGVGIPTLDNRGRVIRRGRRWLYQPTPKQVLLHNATAPNVLWGGAAGGSKSTGLRWDAYKRCLLMPGYRVLLMRRLATELFEHHLDLARQEVEPFGARVVENEIRFPNGSLIRGGHCQHPGDELRFLSIEYDCIDIDELATLEQSQANEIMSRARSTKEGVKAMVRCTSNPGGAHTLYVVDRWITKTITKEDDPFYDPADFIYIPARLYDNPYLMDDDGTFTTYEKRLGPLPPQRRDQLLNGDWSAITGQFFPEFRDRDVGQGGHIPPHRDPEGHQNHPRVDWGFNDPGCCLWLAMLPDSHVHVAPNIASSSPSRQRSRKRSTAKPKTAGGAATTP